MPFIKTHNIISNSDKFTSLVEAVRLLMNTDKSVDDIAQLRGCKSEATVCMSFKQHQGEALGAVRSQFNRA